MRQQRVSTAASTWLPLSTYKSAPDNSIHGAVDLLGASMRPATVTLKNYRAFADTEPVSIEIGDGFTALVGPNNSRKSSFLKFFIEFRDLWRLLRDPAVRGAWITRKDDFKGVALREVVDPAELVSDVTGRRLEVEIAFKLSPKDTHVLSKVRLRAMPGTTYAFGGEFFFGPDATPVRAHNGGLPIDAATDGYPTVDTSPLDELSLALERAMYVGPFRNAINTGTGDYYGLKVGTSFIDLWNTWQAGDSRAHRLIISRITDDLARIFGYKQLEIGASNDKRTLLVNADRRSYRLRDVGAGLAQFIILFGNVAIEQPTLLLIDEPELNLHPLLQIDFLTSLASYTQLQTVVFATHSIGLARSTAERIYVFRRPSDAVVVKPIEHSGHLSEFLGEMSFSTFQELGYDTLLLVEGVTEIKAVQQILRKMKKDHRIVLVPLAGGNLIRSDAEYELADMKRLSNNVWALIDSERASAGDPLDRQRQGFLTLCSRLGIRAHATERRAFENYLTDDAVQAVKGAGYRGLQPYERLEEAHPRWGKSENWRIVREMSLPEIMSNDLGQFLAAI